MLKPTVQLFGARKRLERFSQTVPLAGLRRSWVLLFGCQVLVFLALVPGLVAEDWKSLALHPSTIVLEGPGSTQQLSVTATDDRGFEVDVTDQSHLASSNPAVVTASSATDPITGRSAGQATVRARFGGLDANVQVRVGSQRSEMGVSFARDVISILTIKGCNGSSCHGSPAGQNGFKLSLFGQDVAADHEMIALAHGGRRVELHDPARSLLLQKPTFEVTHGGGRLLTKDSEEYEAILTWLERGARLDGDGVYLERLELYPRERVLIAESAEQPLIAVGRLSDGSTRDMTAEVRYFAGDEAVARVSSNGRVEATGPGMTTVLARALGRVATSQIGVVAARAGNSYPDHRPRNFIDTAVKCIDDRLR